MATMDHKHDSELQEVEASLPDGEQSWTAEEENKLVRKIDLYLLPTIWLMYLLSYMVGSLLRVLNVLPILTNLQDRTNIGNAKLAGMGDDLKLSSNEYSVSLVVFFVTYVFFEAPSNMVSIPAIAGSLYRH